MKNQFDMNIVIAHPKDEKQKNALTAVLEAMEIKFEEEIPYNEAFVAKIKNSKKQVEDGKFTEVKAENITSFIDGL
jgi:MinD superfamily P-loop ATPase